MDRVWYLQKEHVLPVIPMKDEKILLAHGAGGRQSRSLIEELILAYFNDESLASLPDSATLDLPERDYKICFTTDSFVVSPIFFPGGDIGKLAICGTMNDLSVSGAKPLFISISFIIEEGFPVSDFKRILKSMSKEAKRAKVRIVTGDTKVVEKGKCDGIFVNTSGIGIKDSKILLGVERIMPGDEIILSGVPGMHELSIVCARGNIKFEKAIKSDCSSLHELIFGILETYPDKIKFMRDPTRGGLAAVLNEIASTCDFGLKIFERNIPLNEQVRSICEILGFDIMNLACEGRVLVVVDPKFSEKVVSIMRRHPLGKKSSIIGKVTSEFRGTVRIETTGGSERLVKMPYGVQLPRIC